jgi:hypothetical protein
VVVVVVPGEAEAGAVTLAVNNVIADEKVVVVVLTPDTDAAISGLRQAALLSKQQQSRLLITDGDKGESLASIVANCAAFGGASVVALAFFLLGTDLTPSLLAKVPFVKACSLIASAAKARGVDVDRLVLGDLSDAFEQLGIKLNDDAVVAAEALRRAASRDPSCARQVRRRGVGRGRRRIGSRLVRCSSAARHQRDRTARRQQAEVNRGARQEEERAAAAATAATARQADPQHQRLQR